MPTCLSEISTAPVISGAQIMNTMTSATKVKAQCCPKNSNTNVITRLRCGCAVALVAAVYDRREGQSRPTPHKAHRWWGERPREPGVIIARRSKPHPTLQNHLEPAVIDRRYNAQRMLIWGDRGYSHTRVLEDRPSRC